MSWRTRDARDFADALLGRAKPSSREVADLIAVAERLCAAASSVQPSPAFQTTLRTSLMAEAATALAAAGPASTAVRTHRRAIVTAVLATVFGLVGMSAASASALPGDTLYPVKRGIENTQLAVKRGDSARGAFRLELASKRLTETSGLTKRHSVASTLEARTLREFTKQAGLGSDALVRSFKSTHRRGDVLTINRFASHAASGLASLEGTLNGPAASVLDSAQSQLAAIVQTTAGLCPACGGIDPDMVSALNGTEPSTPPPPPAPPIEQVPVPAPLPAPIGKPVTSTSSSDDSSDSRKRSDDSDSDTDSVQAALQPAPTLSPVLPPDTTPSIPTTPTTPAPPSTPPAPVPPTADFTWSSNPGVGNELRLDFNDASSADATTWDWNFGDGSAHSTERNPRRHEFPTADSYLVTLTVTNAAGGTARMSHFVTVQ